MRSAAVLGLIASLGEAKHHSTFRVRAEANPKKDCPKGK
jgi:hypothetical protein